MATVPASRVEETRASVIDPATIVSRQRTIAYGVLFVAVAFSAVVLLPEGIIRVPPLNDNVLHIIMSKATAAAWSSGKNPTNPWLTSISFGYPLSLHYQHLEYLPVAGLYLLTRHLFSISAIISWSTVLLLSLFPLSIYNSMRRFGFEYLPSAFAGLAAPLIATNALYGFDFSSYVWRGFGLYTQLWGMFLLPLALAAGYRLMREGRGYALATLLLVVDMLCHTVYGYMAVFSLAFIAVVVAFDGGRSQFWPNLWRSVRRLGLLLALTALTGSYFFVPFILDGAYMNRSVWELPSKYNSYGASWVLTNLARGNLFDYHRLPILTILAGIGLIACIVRWREPLYRVPIVLFGAWLVLYFGRPTWGVLLNLLPLSSDMQFHRLIGGVHLGGLLLIGVGLAAPWPWLLRRRSLVPAVGAGLLCILLLLPAFQDRVEFMSQNATWMHQSQDALAAQQPELNALYSALHHLPPGRVYAGLSDNWGTSYRVGSIPMYALLQEQGFDMVGYLYHALSFNADVQVLFNDQLQDQYNLFNVRYVVAPSGHKFPSFVKPIGTFGANTLYQVDTTGYFEFVQSPVTLVGNKSEFYPAASAWMKGPEPGLGQEPRLVLDGSSVSGKSVLPLGQSASAVSRSLSATATPRGKILSEQVSANGSYAAKVEASNAGLVMAKVTYHPGWRVTVDGRTVEPVMLMPSFVGIPVPAGTHTIKMVYQTGGLRDLLTLFGIVVLGMTVVAERRRAWIDLRIEQVIDSKKVRAVRDWFGGLKSWFGSLPLLRNLRAQLPYLGVIALLTLLVGLPLLQFKIMAGHDALEYLPRSEEFYKGLSFGHWFPRWAPDLSGGRGQPFFSFNPPLIYYLIAFFHFVGFTFIASQDLAIFVLLLLSALGMYLLAGSFFGPRGGVISSAAYLFAPYFLVTLYVRHALADFAAFAFLPFLFWGVYHFAERGGFKRLAIGVLALALLTLSSNPVALIMFPGLLLLLMALSWYRRSWPTLVRGAWSIALGLGLSAFFWLPALTERQYVHLTRLLQGGLRFENHFVYVQQLFHSKWGYGLSVPGTGDGMSFEIGLLQLALIAVVIGALFWGVRTSWRVTLLVGFMTLLTFGAAFLSTNLSTLVWNHLSLLRYLEYPWRFLSLVAFATAFVAGGVILLVRNRPRYLNVVTVGAILLIVSLGLGHAKPSTFRNVTDAQYSPTVIAQQNLAVTTAQEYQPVWVQELLKSTATVPVVFKMGSGSVTTVPDSTSAFQRYVLNVRAPSLIQFNTDYFPGWTLKVNGVLTKIDASDPTGAITLNLKPGQYLIQLAFGNTPVRTVSIGLSWLTLILLLLTALAYEIGREFGKPPMSRLLGWLHVSEAGPDGWEMALQVPSAEPLRVRELFTDWMSRMVNTQSETLEGQGQTGDVAGSVLATSRSQAATDLATDSVESLTSKDDSYAVIGDGEARIKRSVLIGIYLCFLAVFLVFTPGHFYSTDQIAIYLTTQSLVQHHSLAIKAIHNTVLGTSRCTTSGVTDCCSRFSRFRCTLWDQQSITSRPAECRSSSPVRPSVTGAARFQSSSSHSLAPS